MTDSGTPALMRMCHSVPGMRTHDGVQRTSRGEPLIALLGAVIGFLASLATFVGMAWLYFHTTMPGFLLTDRPLSWPSLVVVGAIGSVLTLVLRHHRFFGVGVILGAALWSFATIAVDLIEDDILRRIGLL